MPKGNPPAAPIQRWRAALILTIFTVAVAAAAFVGWWYARESPPHQGPLILISIDTLRADRLPVYGYTRVKTPAIDTLAADGIVFERAYSHSPQTLPAHASLLTGRLPFEHGVRDNVGYAVKDGERTIAERLRSRGFATGAAVSSYVLRREAGIAQGFTFFDGEMSPEGEAGAGLAAQRDGAATLDAAERWLASNGDRRFFLFLHLYEPHKPYAPPARFASYAPYDGEVAYADELVGRLLRTLKERDLYDDATILLVGDHGEGLGNHGEQEHGTFLYDESVRVPFIVKQPDATGAGRRIATPVQHIDVVPTLLDLVRAPIPSELHGRSLRPILDSEDGTIPEHEIYAEAFYPRLHFGWSELYSLTDSQHRYIRAPREELYDIRQDPREGRNIATEQQETAAAMRRTLHGMTADQRLDGPSEISAADAERFAALGYVIPSGMSIEAGSTDVPDPKDRLHVLEPYRAALDLISQRCYADAIAGLERIVKQEPAVAEVWAQLGSLLLRTARTEEAVAAYRKVAELRPDDANALVSVAAALARLRRHDEAWKTAERAAELAGSGNARARVAAHETLARLALARKEPAKAATHAEEAQRADSRYPLPSFVRGRLLYDEGKYEEALAAFQEADTALNGATLQIPELQASIGDTLSRLDRYAEAEKHFRKELRLFPQNIRAYASLAMLYRASNRDELAERAIAELVEAAPTPEGYAIAARLWTIFGARPKADALRADARKRFRGDPSLKLLDRER